MTNTKKSYCTLCGSLEKEYEGSYFDEQTGEKEKHLACSNINCQIGCSFEGHITKYTFMDRLLLRDEICKRCGKGLSEPFI